MLALITGASSGMGKDMAIYLNEKGYDTILVARDEKKLLEVQNELLKDKTQKVDIKIVDLSNTEECKRLYKEIKENYGNIDLLVNNAGFGLFGEFINTNLDKEIDMINTNVKAVHILMKLFLKDMMENNSGKILNVASIAGFMPGPLMATYYATKNYIVRLSEAVREELKKANSKVTISILCPGPVNTNFNKVADVKFNLKGLNSKQVAKYAIDKTLKGKFFIVPGFTIKLVKIFSKITPDKLLAKICYHMQEKKR